jgi:outer membrane protein TolC
MRKLIFIVVLLIPATVSLVYGESYLDSEPDLQTLTLEQCIEIALQRSSSIRTANMDLRSAELDVADARANYLPEIDVTGQYRFSDAIDFGWERQNYDAQVTADYVLWDHGRREAELAQSRAGKRGVESDYERTKQNLIFNITQAYYDLLQAEKLIDVNQKLLEISRTNVAKAMALQEVGRAIPSDVATARVQQADDELALINAENSFDLARARMASLMGLDPGTGIGIEDDPDYELYISQRMTTREISLENAIMEALQKRPELIRLDARLTSLEWTLRLARWDRYPIISAECGYNILLDDYLRDRDDFEKYRNWNVAFRLSFPIFDGGTSRRREENAEIAVRQVKQDINDSRREIALEVQQNYLDLERAKKSLDIAREQVINATESLNVTQGRYEQNMVIFLEVLSAQVSYAQALTNQVRAFYDYKIAEKALQRAVGVLGVDNQD